MTETSPSHYEVIDTGECVNVQEDNQEIRYLELENATQQAENQTQTDIESDDSQYYRKKRKSKPKYSEVWTKFTIINNKHHIASCNICGAKLSFKTTISNMKKHIERKHKYDISKSNVLPYQEDNQENRFLELGNAARKAENQADSDSDDIQCYDNNKKSKPMYSEIWTKFTIINRKYQIAKCNICGAKLSFKSTTSNLKKHVERKHNYDISKSNVMPYQSKHRPIPTIKPKLTELGGLDGLILNVVADEGENPLEFAGQEAEHTEVQDRVHDYCAVDGEDQREHITKSVSRDPKTYDRAEKMKRNRIMDLQLECLELKKYNMQMETLLLEQQLNLPRSLYTENLRGCDNVTRGTQTDVGGSNTKVFYVTDNNGSGTERSQHLFTFQARLQD